MKRRSTDSVTAELCKIIEGGVRLDSDQRRGPKQTKTETISRFGELLNTPGLDVNSSTSGRNSLLGHLMMHVEKNYISRWSSIRPPTEPDFPLTGRLLSLLMANPSVNVADRVYFYRGTVEQGSQSIVEVIVERVWQPGSDNAVLGDAWKALLTHPDLDPNAPVIAEILEDKTIDMDVLRAIVKNRQLDPATVTSEMGHPLLATLICRALDEEGENTEEENAESCTLVDAFLARSDANPNIRVWHSIIPDPEEDGVDRTHPVILATWKDFRTYGDDTDRMYMTKAILKHPRVDISDACPKTSATPAALMKQMLSHKTFDIHNLVSDGVDLNFWEQQALDREPYGDSEKDEGDSEETDGDETSDSEIDGTAFERMAAAMGLGGFMQKFY